MNKYIWLLEHCECYSTLLAWVVPSGKQTPNSVNVVLLSAEVEKLAHMTTQDTTFTLFRHCTLFTLCLNVLSAIVYQHQHDSAERRA